MSDDFDENRQLCDDGNCLGVVVDGKCNVCGLVAVSSPRDPGSGVPGLAVAVALSSPRDPGSGIPGATVTGDGEAAAGDATEGGDARAAGSAAAGDDGFDDERQLCPDGACIGVLGPDGKCKECGRSAAT